MKISQLVGELLRVQQESGDIEVYFASDISPTDSDALGDQVEIVGVSTCVGENDEGLSVLICDRDTFDAFYEGPDELDFA